MQEGLIGYISLEDGTTKSCDHILRGFTAGSQVRDFLRVYNRIQRTGDDAPEGSKQPLLQREYGTGMIEAKTQGDSRTRIAKSGVVASKHRRDATKACWVRG